MRECVVLKASAGTGKTYRLSLEYIKALIHGENYRDILVMTFTKKATGEIKERILQFLEKIVRGEGEDILNNILGLDKSLEVDRDKLKEIYREVSVNRDRLKIYTIDSFVNSIFKNVIAPYLNILSYDIIDDVENEEILRKTFEKIVENRKEFGRFKKFFEKNTERNIDNYLESIKNLIYDRWKMLLIEEKGQLKKKNPYEVEDDLTVYMDSIVRIIEEIKIRKKNQDPVENFFKSAYKKYFPLDIEKKNKFIEENWNTFVKDDKLWNGNKTKSTKAVDISDLVSEMEDINEKLKEKISLKIYNKDVIDYENEIVSFISNLYSIYDNIKFTEKRFTHNDISSYTFKYINSPEINLIDENGVTDYFLEIFEGDIKTLFIDEFQDTSILQWKILNGIIKRSESVICVGDEKQSIYGWRGGEKSLFENLDSILNGRIETLNVSYRSKESVVEFTNKIFTSISNSYDEEFGEMDLAWNFTSVEGKSKELGYVEILENDFGEEDEKTTGEILVEDIERKFKGDYHDLCVIARTNRELNEIGRLLSERKIPYILDSNESIVEHRAIEGIYKLFKFLVYEDYFSLLEFLRCDLININSKSMKEVIEKRFLVESFLRNEMETLDFLGEIFEKIRHIKNILKDHRGQLKYLYEEVIKAFGIGELYKTKSDLKNLNFFIDLMREYGNIYDFLRDLEENKSSNRFKQVSLEEKNAVILMTIHKSKGLEYETVYYYHRALPSRGGSGLQFHIELSKDYESVLNYLFIDKKYEKLMKFISEDYGYIEEKAYKDKQEEINALYVVLTRAKNNLIVVLDKKVDKYLQIAFENLEKDTFGVFKREEREKELSTEEKLPIEVDFQMDLCDEDKLNANLEKIMEIHREFNLEAESKRLMGTGVHFYLENIIYDTEEERKKSFNLTMSKYGTLIGEERLYTILKSKELDEFMKKNKLIFSREWDYIYPEYEIYVEATQELRRIDRIMIKKPKDYPMGEILIVDYKTGGMNQSQIDEYVHLIEEQLRDIGEYENYNVKGEFMEIKLPEIKL